MDIHYGLKRSGIKKELQEKLEDWLKSIDDDHVRKLAAKNTIVCGGAIASMLLGEKVNDFDLYFRTKDTTLAVAQYYVDKFNAMNNSGVESVVRQEQIENAKGELEDRVIIYTASSGVNRSDEDDTFTTDENDTGVKYRPLFLSENAISLSHKIQLITRFYGDPDTIFGNFDYLHAANSYSYVDNHLELNPEALECLLSRTLVYRGSLFPIASLMRLRKFINRGWRVSAGELLKISWQISELNLKDPKVIREQLTGCDIFYMQCLVNALQDIDADKLNATYVCKIIDNIFG